MPDFRFHLSRFLRSPRSSRSHSSSANPRNDAAASDSPSPRLTPALYPHPSSSSTYCAPQQDTHVTTAASHSPTAGRLIPDHPGVDKAVETSDDRAEHISQQGTLMTTLDTASAPNLSRPNSTSPQAIPLPHLLVSTESTQLLHSSCSLGTPSQQSLVSELPALLPGNDFTPSQYQSQEVFKNARDFSVVGSNFIDNTKGNMTLMTYFNATNQFMEKLLKETIPGAASDSSARDPPPRCHPGTRLEILERCLYFVAHCEGTQKMRWVVGAAGVGKSAIMQSVTESPKLPVEHHASVFLSINGRNDGAKTIITLSYQFAAKSDLYRRVIEGQVNRDPSLLQSSMTVQFEKFIVQTFIHNRDLNSAGRVLIIVDGLDECKETRTQVELLRLITNFCVSYPSSPIVWLVASRPEPHIISFFAKPEVTPAYEKEEIVVDSNEARADVERFLRHELSEIGRASNSLDPSWPDEPHLWKLANAAGGLFAYAQAVIRYVGDSNVCDPASQLLDVLNVIDELPLSELSREEHPMALLDALYARILSNVPLRIMVNARKILLALASQWDLVLGKGNNLIVLCNWLGMTPNEAYTALNRLRAVLDFPERHEAHQRVPKPFHKSFFDYLHRSGFSNDIKLEARQLMIKCALRVLTEAPDGSDCDTSDMSYHYGVLARCQGRGDKISFSWTTQAGIDWSDARTRQSMYQLAFGQVVQAIERGDPMFETKAYIQLLITQFWTLNDNFPFDRFRDLVLDKAHRNQFVECSILKEIPAKAISISDIDRSRRIKMWFRRPVTTVVLPDAWEPHCEHEREGQYSQGREQRWATGFKWRGCTFCSDRLTRQLESLITRSPDHAVTIMFTLSFYCCIEVEFVDPEDGVSEWTYSLWLFLPQDSRMKLGSTI